MSQFLTIIHVAALAERGGQRCRRCGEILIDAAGAMTYGGPAESMRSYAPGGFVGVTRDGRGRGERGALGPNGWFPGGV